MRFSGGTADADPRVAQVALGCQFMPSVGRLSTFRCAKGATRERGF